MTSDYSDDLSDYLSDKQSYIDDKLSYISSKYSDHGVHAGHRGHGVVYPDNGPYSSIAYHGVDAPYGAAYDTAGYSLGYPGDSYHHGRHYAQTQEYGYEYVTSDSSADEVAYVVTEYVEEEYQVAKKVPVVETNSVPYQVAVTNYVQEAYDVETLVPVIVDVQVPYTIER